MSSNKRVVWYFTDGKPGHENQAKGLIQAMAQRLTIESYAIAVPTSFFSFIVSILSGRLYRQLKGLTKADYLVAVGRRTHLPMLLSHFWFKGKRIVLMRSMWPLKWFDLAIIPAHDQPRTNTKTLITRGVINKITPNQQHDSKQGLILLGGPSKHFQWDNAQLINQIEAVMKYHPEIHWTIANSRRTPDDFVTQLTSIKTPYTFLDHNDTSATWLPQQLASSSQVWVSPDSVSMLYESITSGAAVGSFDLTPNSQNRIIIGINSLINDTMLTPFSQWQHTHQLTTPTHQLNEAQRAADWILSQ